MNPRISLLLALVVATGCAKDPQGSGDDPTFGDTGNNGTTELASDDDGDGWSELDGDCDDDNRHANPGEEEDPYNGFDDDCDESTPDDDLDGDGVSADEDCDDEDPNAFPGNTEDHTDGIDNDCDDEIDERFATETIEDGCDCGNPSAIQVDSAGVAHVIYAEPDWGWIRHRSRATDGTWSSYEYVVEDSGWSGEWLDLAIDGGDNLHVAYSWMPSSQSWRELNFTYMDSSGSWWGTYIVDDGTDTGSNNVGAFVDIKVDSSNLPSFAYMDYDRGVPVLADYTAFGSAIYADADINVTGSTGYYATLGLDSRGYDHVAYYNDGWASDVRYTNFLDGTFSEVVDSSTGIYIDLEVRPDDVPCMAYHSTGGADLRYACRENGSWSVETVDSAGSVGVMASIAFTSSGTAYIAYYDESNHDLKVASNADGSWDVSTVDSDGDVGWWPYITVDRHDVVHISYYDATNAALKYANGN